jgi:hypothetical protein
MDLSGAYVVNASIDSSNAYIAFNRNTSTYWSTGNVYGNSSSVVGIYTANASSWTGAQSPLNAFDTSANTQWESGQLYFNDAVNGTYLMNISSINVISSNVITMFGNSTGGFWESNAANAYGMTVSTGAYYTNASSGTSIYVADQIPSTTWSSNVAYGYLADFAVRTDLSMSSNNSANVNVNNGNYWMSSTTTGAFGYTTNAGYYTTASSSNINYSWLPFSSQVWISDYSFGNVVRIGTYTSIIPAAINLFSYSTWVSSNTYGSAKQVSVLSTSASSGVSANAFDGSQGTAWTSGSLYGPSFQSGQIFISNASSNVSQAWVAFSGSYFVSNSVYTAVSLQPVPPVVNLPGYTITQSMTDTTTNTWVSNVCYAPQYTGANQADGGDYIDVFFANAVPITRFSFSSARQTRGFYYTVHDALSAFQYGLGTPQADGYSPKPSDVVTDASKMYWFRGFLYPYTTGNYTMSTTTDSGGLSNTWIGVPTPSLANSNVGTSPSAQSSTFTFSATGGVFVPVSFIVAGSSRCSVSLLAPGSSITTVYPQALRNPYCGDAPNTWSLNGYSYATLPTFANTASQYITRNLNVFTSSGSDGRVIGIGDGSLMATYVPGAYSVDYTHILLGSNLVYVTAVTQYSLYGYFVDTSNAYISTPSYYRSSSTTSAITVGKLTGTYPSNVALHYQTTGYFASGNASYNNVFTFSCASGGTPVNRVRFAVKSTVYSNTASFSNLTFYTQWGRVYPSIGGGVFNGPSTSNCNVNFVVQQGEWLELKFPALTNVYQYSITTGDAAPASWILCGSNVYPNTWTMVDSVSNNFNTATSARYTANTPGSYQFYRLQCLETRPGVSNAWSVGIQFYDINGVHLLPNLASNSTTLATPVYRGAGILGRYEISGSTGVPSNVFSSAQSQYTFGSYDTLGRYIGSNATSDTTLGYSIPGDWIQIKFPVATYCPSVSFQSIDKTAAPTNVTILASNDAITWNVFASNTMLFNKQSQLPSSFTATTLVNPSPTGSFIVYRVVVSNVMQGSNGYADLSVLSMGGPRLNPYMSNAISDVLVPNMYSGNYTGSTSTTVATGAILGEWIQVNLTSPILSNVLAVTPLATNEYFANVTILGANVISPATWVQLGPSVTRFNYGNSASWYRFTNSTAFSSYRIVISRMQETPVANAAATATDIQLLSGRYQPLIGGGTVGPTILGPYYAASNAVPDNAWVAFSGTGTQWVSNGGYISTTGAPISSNAFLQVTLPEATMATKYSLQNPIFSSWILLGSSDGSTFSTIDARTNFQSSNIVEVFTIGTPGMYSVYRLTISTSIYGSNSVALSDFSLWDANGRINEFLGSNYSIVGASNTVGGKSTVVPDSLTFNLPNKDNVYSYTLTSNGTSFPSAWTLVGNYITIMSPSTIVEWPPVSLAQNFSGTNPEVATLTGYSYGNGTYYTSTSSWLGQLGEPNDNRAIYAFDKIVDRGGNGSNIWNTGQPFLGASGTYYPDGTYGYWIVSGYDVVTTISGAAHHGEWLQIQLPTSICLQAYSIQSRADSFYTQCPNTWILAGSDDGITWSAVDQRTNQAPQSSQIVTYVCNSPVSYAYYRIVVSKIGTWGSQQFASIGEMRLFGSQVFTGTEYPPVTLTTGVTGTNPATSIVSNLFYGTGTYVLSGSSSNVTANAYPFMAFDKSVQVGGGLSPYTPANAWVTSNAFAYSNTLGTYLAGAFATVASGTTYNGEWLQVKLPSSTNIYGYSIQSKLDKSNNFPYSWVMCGSQDGSTWTLTDQRQTQTYANAGSISTFYMPGSNAYQYFRLVTSTIQPQSISGGFMSIGELRLFSTIGQVTEFPPSTLYPATGTANSSSSTIASGTYIMASSTSNNASANNQCVYAFDKAVGNSWTSLMSNYTPATGAYSNSMSTTINGVPYSGEWLQIQLPVAVSLQSYSIQSGGTVAYQQTPNTWVLAGSLDGTTWSLMDYRQSYSYTGPAQVQYFNVYNSYPFTTYRLVVTSVQPGNLGAVVIGELRLFGTSSAGTTVSSISNFYTPTSNYASYSFPFTSPGIFTNYTLTINETQPSTQMQYASLGGLSMYTDQGFNVLPSFGGGKASGMYSFTDPSICSTESIGQYSVTSSANVANMWSVFASTQTVMQLNTTDPTDIRENLYSALGAKPNVFTSGATVSYWSNPTSFSNSAPLSIQANVLHIRDVIYPATPFFMLYDIPFNFLETGIWGFQLDTTETANLYIGSDILGTPNLTSMNSASLSYQVTSTGVTRMKLTHTGTGNANTYLKMYITAPSGQTQSSFAPPQSGAWSGAWVEIQLPSRTQISKYSFGYHNLGSWALIGSNDRINWGRIDEQFAPNASNLYTTSNTTPFRTIRLVANTSSNSSVVIGNIDLYNKYGQVNSFLSQSPQIVTVPTFRGGTYNGVNQANGEYIQVSMPNPDMCNAYAFTGTANTWTLQASNDQMSWITLDTKTNSVANGQLIVLSTPVPLCNTFRVVSQLTPAGPTGTASVGQLALYNSTGRSILPPLNTPGTALYQTFAQGQPLTTTSNSSGIGNMIRGWVTSSPWYLSANSSYVGNTFTYSPAVGLVYGEWVQDTYLVGNVNPLYYALSSTINANSWVILGSTDYGYSWSNIIDKQRNAALSYDRVQFRSTVKAANTFNTIRAVFTGAQPSSNTVIGAAIEFYDGGGNVLNGPGGAYTNGPNGGEWIQFTFPKPTFANSMVLGFFANSIPTSFTVQGSMNFINWTIIKTQTNAFTTGSTLTIPFTSNTFPYRGYRFTAQSSRDQVIAISTANMYTAGGQPLVANITTANQTFMQTSSLPSFATGSFTSNASYYTTAPYYRGTNFTVFTDTGTGLTSNVQGDYYSVASGTVPLSIQKYCFVTSTAQTPNTWVLVGSNDNFVTGNVVSNVSLAGPLPSGSQINVATTNTFVYSNWRLVVTRVNSSTSSPFSFGTSAFAFVGPYGVYGNPTSSPISQANLVNYTYPSLYIASNSYVAQSNNRYTSSAVLYSNLGYGRGTYTVTTSATDVPNSNGSALFDASSAAPYMFSTAPKTVLVQLPANVVTTGYMLTSNLSATPTAWTFAGSQDFGVTWTTLDTKTSSSFATAPGILISAFQQSSAYNLYRFTFTAPTSGTVHIRDVQIYGYPQTLPTPNTIVTSANCLIWMDATDTGSTLNDYDYVTSWKNKGTLGNFTIGSSVLYRRDVAGGFPAVIGPQYTSGSIYKTVPINQFNMGNSFTLFSVIPNMLVPTVGFGGPIIERYNYLTDPNTQHMKTVGFGDGSTLIAEGGLYPMLLVSASGGSSITTTPSCYANMVLSVTRYDASNSRVSFYIGSNLLAYNPPISLASDAVDNLIHLQIGAASLTSSSLYGGLSEIILYGNCISDAERIRVTNYLQIKWGISGSFCPLDYVSNIQSAKCLFGTKRLLTSYTGPVLQLRGSGDATQTNLTNFYADPNGSLATLGGSNLLTWFTTNGYTSANVRTWYDQSGLGLNATQTTLGLQPLFNTTSRSVDFTNITASNLVTATPGPMPIGDTAYTVSIRHGTTKAAIIPGLFGSGAVGANTQCDLLYDSVNTRYVHMWGSDDYATAGGTLQSGGGVVTFKYTPTGGSARTTYINGTQSTTTAILGGPAARATTNSVNYIGRNSAGVHAQCPIAYVALFGAPLSDADRLAVENI